ncbi:MAG: LysM peptidoglycan-binding domain-containing protein [Pseudomonadota bacterium]
MTKNISNNESVNSDNKNPTLKSTDNNLDILSIPNLLTGLNEEIEEEPIEENEEFDDENQDVISEEKQGYDIPVVFNERVKDFIHYFQTTKKKTLSIWLAKSSKYVPMMQEIFRKKGLPEDLVYLSMIESGFSPRAYSYAHASGPWQFIKGTGQRYGLRIDKWVDERRDPEKSTIAAAKYLKDLYGMFDSWHLATAAYNAGESKILQAIERYDTRDFWEIAKYPYLTSETKDYVPKLLAGIIIAKDPDKYGFDDIGYKLPLAYNKVEVPYTTNLKFIAKACKTDYSTIKKLNPELKKGCTPPNYLDYEVKIPFGKKEVFAKNFYNVEKGEIPTFTEHTIKRGETLSKISRLYKTSTASIMQLNTIKNPKRIKAGTTLIIPVTGSKIAKRDTDKKRGFQSRTSGRIYLSKNKKAITYTVRKGDTLWDIAQRYDLRTSDIRNWNKIGVKDTLHPGTTLKLMVRLDPKT